MKYYIDEETGMKIQISDEEFNASRATTEGQTTSTVESDYVQAASHKETIDPKKKMIGIIKKVTIGVLCAFSAFCVIVVLIGKFYHPPYEVSMYAYEIGVNDDYKITMKVDYPRSIDSEGINVSDEFMPLVARMIAVCNVNGADYLDVTSPSDWVYETTSSRDMYMGSYYILGNIVIDRSAKWNDSVILGKMVDEDGSVVYVKLDFSQFDDYKNIDIEPGDTLMAEGVFLGMSKDNVPVLVVGTYVNYYDKILVQAATKDDITLVEY